MARKTKAFTLLELLLVLALLGTMAALAWPIWRSVSDLSDLESASRLVLAQARTAQGSALAAGGDCALTWLSLGGRPPAQYRIVLAPAGGGAAVLGSYDLPSGFCVSTNFPGQSLNYTSAGTPSRGGTITLVSPAGRRRYIIASGIGRLRLSNRNE